MVSSDMQDKILTAAKVANIILIENLKNIIEEKTSHKISVKIKKICGRLRARMSSKLVYFEN